MTHFLYLLASLFSLLFGVSFGAGGSSSSSHQTGTSQTTNPWSSVAAALSSTLTGGLKSLAGGGDVTGTIKALTASSGEATKAGSANIREAYGAAGGNMSTGLAKSLADYSTQQTTALNTSITQAEEFNTSTMLQSLQDIIALGTGTSTTNSQGAAWGSQFGWDLNALLVGKK